MIVTETTCDNCRKEAICVRIVHTELCQNCLVEAQQHIIEYRVKREIVDISEIDNVRLVDARGMPLKLWEFLNEL